MKAAEPISYRGETTTDRRVQRLVVDVEVIPRPRRLEQIDLVSLDPRREEPIPRHVGAIGIESESHYL
jgi:hypothetical protein